MNANFTSLEYKDHQFKIHYWERKTNGPVILYLHGLGCSKKDFEGAAKIKKLESYYLVAFDFPGSNGSTYPTDMQLTVDDLVEITNIFISKLGIKEVYLVGHSVGGMIGLIFAEKYPQKVKAFANVEGNLAISDCFFSHKVAGRPYENFINETWKEILAAVRSNPNQGFRKYYEHLSDMNPKAYFDYCPSVTEYSANGGLIEKFVQIPIPKIFIYGEKNNHLPYLSSLSKKIHTAEIAHSGHWPMHDNPESFYKTLADFIVSIIINSTN